MVKADYTLKDDFYVVAIEGEDVLGIQCLIYLETYSSSHQEIFFSFHQYSQEYLIKALPPKSTQTIDSNTCQNF